MRGQKIAVERVVGVGEEGARAAVAALGDMMRQAGNDDAGETGHAATWPRRSAVLIECTVTVIRVS
jgi:hypothetical protein